MEEIPEELEIEISGLAYGGAGIGRADGFVVMVQRGLPGDRLKVRITARHSNYAEGTIIERLVTSPGAVLSPCPHFDLCGGCQWMHLAYARQLETKQAHVLESMERIGARAFPDLLSGCTVHPILGAPKTTGYRNKIEFSFGASTGGSGGTSAGAGDRAGEGAGQSGLTLGLHRFGPGLESQREVIDIPNCLIGGERIDAVARFVREALADAGGSATLRHLVVREGKRTGEILVNLITSPGAIPGEGAIARALLEKRFGGAAGSAVTGVASGDVASGAAGLGQGTGQVVGMLRTIGGSGRSGATPGSAGRGRGFSRGGREERLLAGEAHFTEEILGLRFQIAASAFFQVNTEQAEVLYRKTIEFAEPRAGEEVLDLYCGVGGLTLALAARAGKVAGVENASSAIRCARANATGNRFRNVVFVEGEARREVLRLARERRRFPLITVNPPRSGLHEEVLTGTVALEPERIAYVSCNPATLARDAALYAGKGYRLVRLQPVDMFPHSYHVESIALFARRGVA